MLKGFPRLAIGVLWLVIGGFSLVIFLTDRHSLDSGHAFSRWLFAGLVGLVAGPLLVVWGAAEMMFRRRPKGGGVFEREGLGASHMADVTDAICVLAKTDGPTPSPATIAAATHAINANFACDFSEGAIADRIAHYNPSPQDDPLAFSIAHGFSSMDERFRADFAKALLEVATADGVPSQARTQAFGRILSAIRPPSDAVTAEMRSLLQRGA
ncbi:MAG: hypothetical protein HY054_05550 [Proteobacteria bacterium]|nr:hypothetical protein [Pseudomonadota bacterium]